MISLIVRNLRGSLPGENGIKEQMFSNYHNQAHAYQPYTHFTAPYKCIITGFVDYTCYM